MSKRRGWFVQSLAGTPQVWMEPEYTEFYYRMNPVAQQYGYGDVQAETIMSLPCLAFTVLELV